MIFLEEPAMAKMTDDMVGGWKGIDTYWELFEPDFCNVRRKSAYSEDKLATKRVRFLH